MNSEAMGNDLETPNPHTQGKNMNKDMAAKLSSLPCFEAFLAHALSRFVFIFLPCMCVGGGAGVTRAFLKQVKSVSVILWTCSSGAFKGRERERERERERQRGREREREIEIEKEIYI